MEFTNEIFFNKKLIQNETVLITYSGKLYKEYSAEITIVYGFGENWDYTGETKMQEKENGFEAAITLKNYDTFNFCFKNNYNIWDNNFGFNYIASVEPQKNEEPEKTEQVEKTEEIEETKDFEENKNIENTTVIQNKPNEEISEEQKQANIEAAFDNLLNSIMDFQENDINKDVNLENGFGLQSVDEIKETDFVSCDDIFENLYNELANDETNNEQENIQKAVTNEENKEKVEDTKNNEQIDTSALEALLNDFSAKKENKVKTIESQELEKIMDDILNSIIEESENSNIQEAENLSNNELENEKVDLPAEKHSSSVEDFIDKCIDGTYYFFRNIWNGCKKIGFLIKQKTHELLGEDKQ